MTYFVFTLFKTSTTRVGILRGGAPCTTYMYSFMKLKAPRIIIFIALFTSLHFVFYLFYNLSISNDDKGHHKDLTGWMSVVIYDHVLASPPSRY